MKIISGCSPRIKHQSSLHAAFWVFSAANPSQLHDTCNCLHVAQQGSFIYIAHFTAQRLFKVLYMGEEKHSGDIQKQRAIKHK